MTPPFKVTKQRYDENGDKLSSYTMDREAFNCDDKTQHMEDTIFVYFDGTQTCYPMVGSPWTVVKPNTLGNHKLQYICAWKSK